MAGCSSVIICEKGSHALSDLVYPSSAEALARRRLDEQAIAETNDSRVGCALADADAAADGLVDATGADADANVDVDAGRSSWMRFNGLVIKLVVEWLRSLRVCPLIRAYACVGYGQLAAAGSSAGIK
jgi:hypothetical protein